MQRKKKIETSLYYMPIIIYIFNFITPKIFINIVLQIKKLIEIECKSENIILDL